MLLLSEVTCDPRGPTVITVTKTIEYLSMLALPVKGQE
jgi:hypothetical protein